MSNINYTSRIDNLKGRYNPDRMRLFENRAYSETLGLAAEARAEGFDEIAEKFEQVGAIEKHHEERYRKLLKNIENKVVFSRDGDCIWQCSNCGHIVIGKAAPDECPVCHHAQAYFQLLAENY